MGRHYTLSEEETLEASDYKEQKAGGVIVRGAIGYWLESKKMSLWSKRFASDIVKTYTPSFQIRDVTQESSPLTLKCFRLPFEIGELHHRA